VPPAVANGRFEIAGKLGAGCFGAVYRGIDRQTKAEVAVKFESLDSSVPQLEHEASVLGQLRSTVETQGIAEYFHFGREAGLSCLVMEALGSGLEEQLKACGGHFSLRTVVLIADQALRLTEYLHSKCLVHRDIKPDNYMFGVRGRQHHLYLIDFGLSKRYFKQRHHVQLRRTVTLTGTAPYASLNSHRCVELSRRDDLEAMGFMLVYLFRGCMPWSKVHARSTHEKHRRIKEAKEATRMSDLCKGLPEEFESYLTYCRSLLFVERPDYQMLRGLFLVVRERLGKQRRRHIEDYHLEWLDGKGAGQRLSSEELVPLSPHEALVQPDDSSGAKASWRDLWYCGSRVRVRD